MWAAVLGVLLVANFYLHWPVKKAIAAGGGSWRGAEGASQEMREKFELAIKKLPEAEQPALRKRMEEERAFFESVKRLPETERQEKMKEHFAQNPPPRLPGLEGGGPLPGGSGGPGGGGPGGAGGSGEGGGPGRGGPESGHIPPVEVRRGMDKHIVDAQKQGSQS